MASTWTTSPTGHGVKAAAEAALAHHGRALTGAAIAIEGFGKVGAGMALASARAGARIVGVSTVDGLLADPSGLDVDELFSLRERFGDALVTHGPALVRPREELFDLECDVLVPGARPDSITRDVAARLRCAVVAPGANVPYGPGAVAELESPRDRRGPRLHRKRRRHPPLHPGPRGRLRAGGTGADRGADPRGRGPHARRGGRETASRRSGPPSAPAWSSWPKRARKTNYWTKSSPEPRKLAVSASASWKSQTFRRSRAGSGPPRSAGAASRGRGEAALAQPPLQHDPAVGPGHVAVLPAEGLPSDLREPSCAGTSSERTAQ